MKTDPSIYEFLATGVEAFRVLTGGVTLTGAYRFTSLTLKGIERRLDGIYEPEGHDGPVYVIEFQGQAWASARYNLLTKVGLYGELHPKRDVRGVLIFLRKGDDAGAPPAAAPVLFTVAYLDDLLPKWLDREPSNPFVAVFMPLIVKSDEDLRANAPKAWQAIQTANLEPTTRATLERILEFWLFERFPLFTTEEMRTMLSVLTPLEQTRAYQEIFAKGEAKGEARGKAKGLKLQLTRRFGRLPRWAIQRLDTAAMEQLDAWLEGIFDAQSLEDLLGPKPKRGAKLPTH
jgi:predicted transposase YdaD